LIAGYVGHVGATLLNDFPNPVNEILEETTSFCWWCLSLELSQARRSQTLCQIGRTRDRPLLVPLPHFDRYLSAGSPHLLDQSGVEFVHSVVGALASVDLLQQATGAAGDVGHVGATLLNDFPNPVNEILEETDPSVAIRDLSLDDALGKGGTDVRNVRGFCMTWY